MGGNHPLLFSREVILSRIKRRGIEIIKSNPIPGYTIGIQWSNGSLLLEGFEKLGFETAPLLDFSRIDVVGLPIGREAIMV